MTNNFSDDVHFWRAFHVKFIINANIVYIPWSNVPKTIAIT